MEFELVIPRNRGMVFQADVQLYEGVTPAHRQIRALIGRWAAWVTGCRTSSSAWREMAVRATRLPSNWADLLRSALVGASRP